MSVSLGTAVGYLSLDYTQFSKNLKSAVNEASSMSGKLSDTLGEGFSTVGKKMETVGKGLSTAITLPLAVAGAQSVKFGSEFDSSMSSVKAVSGATTKEFNKMRDAAIKWGEKTVYTATEASNALYYMGLAGWSTEESVNGLGPVLNLAAAGNLELGRTSDIVTDAMTAMNYKAGELTDGIENTEHFTNVLAAAMSNSNTDVDQLGSAFKYVAPLAGSLGYSIDDLSIALGLMADVGVKDTQAGTGLRQALKGLIDPTDDAAAMMDKYNVSLFDSKGKAKDLRTFMGELRNTFGDVGVSAEDVSKYIEDLGIDLSTQEGQVKAADAVMQKFGQNLPISQQEKLNAIVEIFGTRALPGVLGIINASEENFNKLSNAVDNSDASFVEHEGQLYTMKEALDKWGDAVYNDDSFTILGAAAGQAQTQMDNLKGDWTKFTSALGTSQIIISDIVNGALRDFVQKLTELVKTFNNLDPEEQKHILKMAAIAAAVGPCVLVFGKLITGLGTLFKSFHEISQAMTLVRSGMTMLITKGKNVVEAFNLAKAGFTGFASQTSTLGTALAGVTAPMVAIAALIAVLVAAFIHLWKTNEEFRNNIIGIWDGIKQKFKSFAQGIVDRLNALGFDFQSITEAISTIWNGFCELLVPVFEGVFNNISIFIGTILDVIIGILDIFIGLFTGNWEQCWTGIKEVFFAIWNGIGSWFKNNLNVLKGVFDVVLKWFGTTWKECWSGIKSFFVNIWNGIKTFFTNVVNAIKNVAVNVFNAIAKFFVTVWNGIKTTFTNVVNSIKTFLSNAWTAIKNTVSTVFNDIKTFFSTVWNGIKTIVTNAANGIKTTIYNVFEAVKNFISNVHDTISSVIKTAWNTIKNTISNVVNGIKTTVTNVWNGIKNTISSILDAISTTVTNIWSGIKNFVSETVEKIKTTVINIFTTMKTKVVDTVSNLKQGIIDAFNGIKEKFSNIGKNIIDGIIGGITGKVSKLYDTVKRTMTGLLEKAKETLGIHSPSKVAKKQIGEQFANGVIEGVKARKGEAKKSAAELSKDIVEAAEKKLDRLETFNKISVADEVSYWKKILGATKKGTDAYLQAYKSYVRAKEDMNAKILSDAEKEMDKLQTYNKITPKGEYEYWKSLLKQLKKGSDEYLQAYKNMLSAKEDMNAKTLSDAEKEMDAMKTYNKITLKGEYEYWKNMLKQFKKGSDEYLQVYKNMVSVKESYTKELENIETEYAKNINGVYEELQNNINNLTKAYDDQIEATKKSLTSAFSLFEKHEIKVDKTGQDLLDSLKSQVDALATYNIQMSRLEGRNILPADLIQNIREMGVDAADELVALNNMTDDQLSQYAMLWRVRNKLALDEANRENKRAYKQLQKDIAQAKKDAADKIDEFTDEYKQKLAELEDVSYSSSTKVGKSTMQGIVDGINSSSKKVNNTVSSALNVVSGHISKMQKQLKTRTTNIMKVIANSITDIYKRVNVCIGNMEDSIVSSVNRMISSLSNMIVLIKDIDNQDFVRYNSNIISSMGKSSNKDTKSSGKDKNEQKDIVQRTYVFYSNKPIDEVEAARQLKKTERDIAEGFA